MAGMTEEMQEYLSAEEQKDFCENISRIIRLAYMHVSIRHAGINIWDRAEKERFKKWFGVDDGIGVARIKLGLWSMKNVLEKLSCSDFLPWTTEIGKALGCPVNENKPYVVAAVCPEPGQHKIMLSHGFLKLQQTGWNSSTQVAVLIHELAHMPDVLGTRGEGERYGFFGAQSLARDTPADALRNSDNVAGYVLLEK